MWQFYGDLKIVNLLSKAIEENNLSHAYLLIGPPHVGKNKLAHEIAKAVNCTGNNPPCNTCDSCKRIERHLHADIFYLSTSASLIKNQSDTVKSSEIGIDEIRQIQSILNTAPYEGNYKVIIIDESDKLSNEAANCLLKTLEEPSKNSIIILLATNLLNLLPTIVSRCQILELKPLSINTVAQYLNEHYQIEDSKALQLAKWSRGCVGQALLVLENPDIKNTYDETTNQLISLINGNILYRFDYVARFDASSRNKFYKYEAESLLNHIKIIYQDLLSVKTGAIDLTINTDKIAELEQIAHRLKISDIRRAIRQINECLSYIDKNVNIRLVLEYLMLHLPPRLMN